MKKDTFYLFGNWKMNGSLSLVQKFADVFKGVILPPFIEATLFVPFPYLQTAMRLPFKIGAQDCSFYGTGAYTGDVSADMIKEIGGKYVLIGHSERRNFYQESTDVLKKKMENALKIGLTPVLCVGENSAQKQDGSTLDSIQKQIDPFLNFKGFFIIAYEPLWAIGTGQAATLQDLDPVFAFIKSLTAAPILYGGSVTAQNATRFITHALIDGMLVGGASLSPDSWQDLVNQTHLHFNS